MLPMTSRVSTIAILAFSVALIGGAAFLPARLGDAKSKELPIREEGPAVKIGNGVARTYVLYDLADRRKPVEIGVAIDAAGLDGLPASGMVMNQLEFPRNVPAPYQFVMFDWNSMGHEPPGIYDLPHFDFHFYLTPADDVREIIPSNPNFAAEANALPAGDYVPPMYAVLSPPGADPVAVAVPQMGVHWSDVRSPELQGMLGNPDAFQPFTRTFIYGSWNGRMTFLEPMITRAHLLGRADEVIEIPQPARYPVPGWYPDAYRITYDEPTNEFRIALTGLAWHE